MENILPAVFIAAIFASGIYFLLIAPQQREFRNRVKLVSEIQPGVEVVTYGGVIGTVRSVDREAGIVQVEIAPGLVVRIVAAAIMHEYRPEEYAESAKKALGGKAKS